MTKSFFILLSLFIFIGCHNNRQNVSPINEEANQIQKLIKESNNVTYPDSIRNKYLIEAYNHLKYVENGSLKINYHERIGYSHFLLRNWDAHLKMNHLRMNFATKYFDTLNLAKANSHIAYNYQVNREHDSAFYYYKEASKYYSLIENESASGRMLLSMATVQEYEKDYTGSEINTIKSIVKLKKSEDYNSLYLAYNNLGVVYNELNQYDLAIEKHQDALKYLKLDDGDINLEAMSLNNIGWIYTKKEDFSKAIEYYQEALNKKNLFKNLPETYATIIDNMAFSKFKLEQKDELPDLFYQSLKIRDSLQILDGVVVSNLHLSEYYINEKDTSRAKIHGKRALNTARESGYMDGLLRSFLNMSKVISKEEANDYLNKFINLSDSLQREERLVREKFTRIAYETDEIKQEKEAEVKQKNQIIVLAGIGAGFGLLLFIIYWQRSKNKQLLLEGERQKANEEVYELMLKQKSKLDKVKEQERNRISEDLHDGVLSKLFGTRMNLGFLPLKGESETLKKHEKLVEELQGIEGEIRALSHELQKEDFGSDQYYVQILEDLLRKQGEIGKFQYKITVGKSVDWNEIEDNIKINCYRMIQEAIQNINKYAKAEYVKVDFTLKNKILKLNIEDNGVGFNRNEVGKGIGIKNFKARTKKLNGHFELNSAPNIGTSLLFNIPI